jgi:hypothetical protein
LLLVCFSLPTSSVMVIIIIDYDNDDSLPIIAILKAEMVVLFFAQLR